MGGKIIKLGIAFSVSSVAVFAGTKMMESFGEPVNQDEKSDAIQNALTIIDLEDELKTKDWELASKDLAKPSNSLSSNLLTPIEVDSPEVELEYPIPDPSDPNSEGSGINLEDPLNFNNQVEYDPVTGMYVIYNSVGENGIPLGQPIYMTQEEYIEYQAKQQEQRNWEANQENDANSNNSGLPTLEARAFEDIFGPGGIDIRPTGTAEISFGFNTNRTDNPQIPQKQRRITTFDFNERIQINLLGTVGDKLKINFSHNTEATFDFENQMKLEYQGYDDEIIQKIEAGNVNLPLGGTLISGAQSLFGIKTELKFGRLYVTSVMSQDKGKRSEINVAGGAQVTEYELKADNYEANRHYFVSQYFHENYDEALQSMPVVNSQINITRMEVWLTNTNNTTVNTRNIVALTDLGQVENLQNPAIVTVNPGSTTPENNANSLYQQIVSNPGVRSFNTATSVLQGQGLSAAVDFEKLENARMLSESEYSYNSLLGYISLNQSLNNDEVLAVAFQYTIGDSTYQVGEFSTDGVAGQDALLLKLLKPTITNPRNPIWDLMMKNIYSIGAYQVSSTNFALNVWYNDPARSIQIPFLPYDGVKDRPLIQILGLDRINVQSSPYPDGYFDFVPFNFNGNVASNGGTINSRNGRIIFTTTEPFGAYLHDQLTTAGMPAATADRIAFTELYDSTKTVAQNTPSKNRFFIKGSYESSSSSEISLNALNIPRGAVRVTAGGNILQENVDYTVDYNLGRVRIINEGLLQSQTPIKVSLESNSLFSLQTKTFLGTRFDYKISNDANLGGTVVRMTERPLTQKINIGDEPMRNTQLGIDGSYRADLPMLTKLIDKLPLIETKEMSTFQGSGEFAVLIPGVSRALDKNGVSYIDDFEGSQSFIDLKAINNWKLASIPKGQTADLFPEGELNNDLAAGYNRARLAWYFIDPSIYYRGNNLTPDNIANNPAILEDHRMREVLLNEVFPNQNTIPGQPQNIAMFDMAYYPSERGPYNFDMDGQPGISSGTNTDGSLAQPDSRWAGIMRELNTTDFELANIEFIQFWVMDPFNEDADPNNNHSGGDLYFNLGNISEDILPDSRKSFENGIPVDGSDDDLETTTWGRVPTLQLIVNAFDNEPSTRQIQDVGLDLLDDNEEPAQYQAFVNWVNASPLNSTAKAQILADVSSDNYHFHRGDDYDQQALDILERYKLINGVEGNSNTSEQSEELNDEGYPTAFTNAPDIEDINLDNNLSESESYFQYKISIRKNDMVVGQNFIADAFTSEEGVKWYQFKIPLREPEKVINGISDFRSIRFLRMFMKGFDDPTVLRFARLDLIRGEWRTYYDDLRDDGEYIPTDPNATTFNVSAVNIEQNGSRDPINYVVPPDIVREIDPTAVNQRQLNEQSIAMEVCGLEDGDARAMFKNLEIDVRQYGKLKMFIHGEALQDEPLNDKDVTVFVRLGTDFVENYYEYEIPLLLTQFGADNANDIWPEQNNMEIIFDELIALKRERNTNQFDINKKYSTYLADKDRRVSIVGNPNLQAVNTIMIGIRNPKRTSAHPWVGSDDGLSKCAHVWVNELRLTDFNQSGGWATVGRMSVKGADFFRFDVAGSMSTPGWGGLETKVADRQLETIKRFDASTSFQLGKLFNENWGIRMPLYLGYSVATINPQYDPLNPDILWAELPNDERIDRGSQVTDYTRQRSMNLTNVGIQRKQGKEAHFWDVANWSATYSYSETYHRDVNVEYNMNKVYRGGLNYQFNNKPKAWEPFKNAGFAKKSPWLRPIKDFNLNLGIKQMAFRNDIMRSYNHNQLRSNFDDFQLQPQFLKQFTWNRGYDIKYDFTKNFKFDFHANNAAIIGEPDSLGAIDRKDDPETYEIWKDSVNRSIRELGETMNYGHNGNINITWPINKLPITDWITLTTRYTASYDWQRAPLSQDSLGNTIQNSRQINWVFNGNLTTLYNHVPYFKKVNQKFTQKARTNSRTPARGGRDNKEKDKGKEDGKDDKGETEDKDKKKKDDKKITFVDHVAHSLMMLKTISINYSTNDGIMLPGYNQSTQLLGMNSAFQAPGIAFITGQQNTDIFGRETDRDFARQIATQGWLIDSATSQYLNKQYTVSNSRNFSARATIEPIKDFRIELTMDKQQTFNQASNFRWSSSEQDYTAQNLMQNGMVSYSSIAWNTAFVGMNDTTYQSNVFDQLLGNRVTVSGLLGEDNPNSEITDTNYYEGYGATQQEVVTGAFLTAYGGRNPNKKNINPFNSIPLPNWRVTYNGLAKLPAVKKYLSRLSVSHGYRSNVSLANYTTNLQAADYNDDGFSDVTDLSGNWINRRQFSTVVVTEQFSPLIGFDATWNLKSKNETSGLITKFEIKKDRNVSLSLANNQLTEILGNELVIGSGYKFNQVPFPFKIGGKELTSDLNIRFDLSIRNNRTIIRKIVENQNQLTSGQRFMSIKSSAEYKLSKALTLRFYFDRMLTKPFVSTAFPTANTSSGLALRFQL